MSTENTVVTEETAPPPNGEVTLEQIAEQQGEPATGAPAPDKAAEIEQQRLRQASQTMREQKERNRANAKERVEAQAWQRIAETLAGKLAQGTPQEQAKPKVDEGPKREQYADWDDYQTAKAAHTAQQAARAEFDRLRQMDAQQRQQAQEQYESNRITYEHETRNRQFAQAVPDFVDVTDRDDIEVPGPACASIKEQPNSPAIVYALGHNPEIASQLWQMRPHQQAAYIGRLSAWLATQSPQISNAAPAGRTVGSKPSPSGDLPDDPEAYMRAANKRFGR